MADEYRFSWDHIGDLKSGRGNLGEEMPVAVYRLFQFTIKDVLTAELGADKAREIFVKAGFLAGREFCINLLDKTLALDAFVAELQARLAELKIGILRIEQANTKTMNFTLTVSEDLDCSGLPVLGEAVCYYDEGFIAGIFTEYSGHMFTATEVDCWATGGRTCRFDVKLTDQ